MARGLPTLIACSALALLAGCGSSKSSAATSVASTPRPSTEPGSFKASTTPKYGTPSATAPVRSGTVQIAYRNITIQPDVLRVKVGSTIRWTNYDSIAHNVTSEGSPVVFKSGDFGEGKTFEVKVTKPGLLHYQCTIHPASMNGTIEGVK
jgi:plastocyanin